MFRKEQLIFVTLLAGCTTVANPPQEVIEPTEPVQVTVIEDNSLLEAIDSTLEGADELLNQIVENKADNENKISKCNEKVEGERNTNQQTVSRLQRSTLNMSFRTIFICIDIFNLQQPI